MMPRAHPLVTAALAAPIAWPAPSAAQAPEIPAATFAIKADPRLAKALNELLAQLGAPAPSKISRTSSGAWMRDDCAGRPAVAPPDPSTGALEQSLELPPCVQVRRNLQTKIRPGDTWDALIARLGLPPGERDKLKVVAPAVSTSSPLAPLWGALSAPFTSRPPAGATAVAPEAAAWTQVQIKVSSGVSTLTALNKAVGAKLGCVVSGGASVEACLSAKGVEIVPVSQTSPKPPWWPPGVAVGSFFKGEPAPLFSPPAPGGYYRSPVAGLPIAPPWVGSAAGGSKRTDDFRTQSPRIVAQAKIGMAGGDVYSTPRSPPPPPPPPSPPPSPSRVADGQWPYDRPRVLKVLEAVKDNPHVMSNIIGLMDVGLADDAGRPLAPAALAADTPGDDRNGATTLGMCSGLDAAALKALVAINDEGYSHGAVTASLAAFVDLKAPDAAEAVLPHILFYRLYGPPCPPQGAPTFNTLVATNAFDHLQLTAAIVNDSSMDTGLQDWITQGLIRDLQETPVLLVTAAGNLDTDLDQQMDGFCPACIRIPGNYHHDDGAAERTIVVGAANDLLARAGHSNFGANTVQIFAPGLPLGALDLLGDDASKFTEPASSYAAPQVARAIAIVQSLTGLNMDQAAHRTFISTWPFFGDDGKALTDPVKHPVGVLDLTKAAAVRTYAVEVMQQQPDGRMARKTYVGDIKGGLQALNPSLCQLTISETKWQALVFKSLDGTNVQITALGRWPVHSAPLQYEWTTYTCQPQGFFHINDVIEGDTTIKFSDVTLILTPIRKF